MKKWDGKLMTSFQMMGSLHLNLELLGYPDVGETNTFFELMKGRNVRVTVEVIE